MFSASVAAGIARGDHSESADRWAVCEVARALGQGLAPHTEDRPYLLTTYRNAFLGSDLVSLLLKLFPSLEGDRAAAVLAGRELQRLGLFDHVCGEKDLEDSDAYFYRLLRDNHPAVLNMAFPWAAAKKRAREEGASVLNSNEDDVCAAQIGWEAEAESRAAQELKLGRSGKVIDAEKARSHAADVAAHLVHDMTVLLSAAKRARTDLSTGLCDYEAVCASASFERFEDFTCALQGVDLVAMGERDRCCFLINVYNICVQHG